MWMWFRRHHEQVDADLAKEREAARKRADQAQQDLVEQRVRFTIEEESLVAPIRRLRPEVVRRNHLNDMAVEALLGKKPRTTS